MGLDISEGRCPSLISSALSGLGSTLGTEAEGLHPLLGDYAPLRLLRAALFDGRFLLPSIFEFYETTLSPTPFRFLFSDSFCPRTSLRSR